jgi:predicted SAM-dependent methyltransferase
MMTDVPRGYYQISAQTNSLTAIQKLIRYVIAPPASLIYWQLAHKSDMPGLSDHMSVVRMGIELLAHRSGLPLKQIYLMLFAPLVSTRYFEFDFAMQSPGFSSATKCLDVSSPRFLPMLMMRQMNSLHMDLVNPDAADLAETHQLIDALQLNTRCQLHARTLEDANFSSNSFDLITSISVVEHIPMIKPAIQKMWDLLKPGGHLILTVPCAAKAEAQYLSTNQFNVLTTDKTGYTFFQLIFDEQQLHENIYAVAGQPTRVAIYGEKQPGFLQRQLHQHWNAGHTYPFWREPYMMSREFCFYDQVSALPGEGVIGLEFIKP